MPAKLQKKILNYSKNNQLSLAALSVILLSFAVGSLTLLMSLSTTLDDQAFDIRNKAYSNAEEQVGCQPVVGTTTIYVWPQGSNGACTNLQTAINNAPEEGIVTLFPGIHAVASTGDIYDIKVHDKRHLTIQGDYQNPEAAQVMFMNTKGGIQFKNSQHINLESLTISGDTANGLIRIEDSNSIVLSNLDVIDITANAIQVANTINSALVNSSVNAATRIAVTTLNSHFDVIGNHIENGALLQAGQSSGLVSQNIVLNYPQEGIYLYEPIDHQITHNTLITNAAESTSPTIGLTIKDLAADGLVSVSQNLIMGGHTGIKIEASTVTADNFDFSYNDVWGAQENYVGMADATGQDGNISADPLLSTQRDEFCLQTGSPAAYGDTTLQEFMGAKTVCNTPTASGCVKAGCAGERCVSSEVADEIATACLYDPTMACYSQYGTCEFQAEEGQCGWTETPELTACLSGEDQPKQPDQTDDLYIVQDRTSIEFLDSLGRPILSPSSIAPGSSLRYRMQYCINNQLKTPNPDPNPEIVTVEYLDGSGHMSKQMSYSLITAHRDGACDVMEGHVSKENPTTTIRLVVNGNDAIPETTKDNNTWEYSFTYQSQQTASCSSPDSATLVSQTAPYTHRLQTQSTGNGIIGSRWDFDADGTWDDETIERTWIDYTFLKEGEYWPEYQIRDINGWSDTCQAADRFQISADPGSEFPTYDLNNDGIVNLLDYELFRQSFMRALLGE